MSRVTIVVNRLDSPSETFQRSLAQILAGAGHEVTFHALRSGGSLPDLGPGVRASTGLPALRPRSVPTALARLARGPEHGLALAARRARSRFGSTGRALRAALGAGPILDTDPEVVHLGFSGIGVALADSLELLDGITLVVSCRGSDELIHPILDPRRAQALSDLLARVDRVHVVADAVGVAVRDLGADPAIVHTIRPAVDTERWTPRPVPEPGPDGRRRVVAVGRLTSAKGIDDLVAASAALADGPDAPLVSIAGDGPHRDALRLRIDRCGLDDTVQLLGAVSPDAVSELLASADLFVCPSLSEGINNGVLEAMARQVPVVATAVGGMPEVITDGVDGWLVPPGRPDKLAAAVGAALSDPDTLDRVARSGRERVVAAFDRAAQAAAWHALYRDLPVPVDAVRSRNVRRREGMD